MMNKHETEQMTSLTTRTQLATTRATNAIIMAKEVKSPGAEKLAREASDLISRTEICLGKIDVRNAGIMLGAAEYNMDRSEKMIQTCKKLND